MPLTVEEHEAKCQEVLEPYWAFANLEPEYPATTGTVVKLMRGLQYVIDAPSITEEIEGGRMIPPRVRGGRWIWMAADIIELRGRLEDTRRWAPLSPLHQYKKSRWEIQRELAAVGQAPPVFNDLEQFSVEELLRQLVEVDEREFRELLYTAIKIKLEQFETRSRQRAKEHIRAISETN